MRILRMQWKVVEGSDGTYNTDAGAFYTTVLVAHRTVSVVTLRKLTHCIAITHPA